ncbi:hypothetical protein [Morganella psychrotolerans]|uniref:Uncharacterized protein n=2 Tax=Morganella psychrotolerans TaxID=368603 RepID=A0A5M9QY67_9GAMM|nr:hypothetical protein [Morganella psychrotolerans]KAA8712997.1 hypothetical protein F4V73_17935 [Morganella psychrotolerans]
MAEMYPLYKAYQDDFTEVLTDFCEAGKQFSSQNMSSGAADARIRLESRKWVKDKFGDGNMPENIQYGLSALIYMGGWSGYSGINYPVPLNKKNNQKVAKEKSIVREEKKVIPVDENLKIAYERVLEAHISKVVRSVEVKPTGETCWLVVNHRSDGTITGTRPDGGKSPGGRGPDADGYCLAIEAAVKETRLPPFLKGLDFGYNEISVTYAITDNEHVKVL